MKRGGWVNICRQIVLDHSSFLYLLIRCVIRPTKLHSSSLASAVLKDSQFPMEQSDLSTASRARGEVYLSNGEGGKAILDNCSGWHAWVCIVQRSIQQVCAWEKYRALWVWWEEIGKIPKALRDVYLELVTPKELYRDIGSRLHQEGLIFMHEVRKQVIFDQTLAISVFGLKFLKISGFYNSASLCAQHRFLSL